MRLMAIDYGTKRIGVAISNEEESVAFPHSVIENNATYVERIMDIARREGIRKIIMGESKDYGGRENPVMGKIHSLKKELEKDYTIILEPEYASSVEAERFQGKGEMRDASAAAIILQRYLDKQTKS